MYPIFNATRTLTATPPSKRLPKQLNILRFTNKLEMELGKIVGILAGIITVFGAIWYCASWATSVNNKITELEKDIETIRLQLDRLSNVKDDVIELKAQIKSFDKIVNILFIQPSLNSALSKGLIKEGSYHITEQGEKIIPNNLKERIKQIVEKISQYCPF